MILSLNGFHKSCLNNLYSFSSWGVCISCVDSDEHLSLSYYSVSVKYVGVSEFSGGSFNWFSCSYRAYVESMAEQSISLKCPTLLVCSAN